jgi:hypothetical protein
LKHQLFVGNRRGIKFSKEFGSAYGTRTRDLCLERANSLHGTGLAQVASVSKVSDSQLVGTSDQ